ncbi:M56 family metallopeptidase [Flagellimonas sp. DF-77]|uniref:M56 family metallopeptidase n=1 Tax=Flagellimonas algarum TaxID=3230298 RepID=UPI0033952E50
MQDIILHLIKSSGILFLFYGSYMLFLKKETLFTENRWFLALGLLTSLLLPFYKIKQTVIIPALPNLATGEFIPTATALDTPTPIDWWFWIGLLYGSVAAVLLLRFLIQLVALGQLASRSEIERVVPFYHVRTKKTIAPFSFFKYIYYNPRQFETEELDSVIAHEEVHAKQYHSLDVLLLELCCILLWFNPVVWLYKTSIKQNLEFIADAETCKAFDKKTYQYLMLRQAVGQDTLALTNSFYNSLIKKRIVMLNQNQSKKTNSLKVLLILPLLGLFLVGFNTDKEYRYDDHAVANSYKSIELIINKNTSDSELLKMKRELAEDAIDFSYTVVHNEAKEIIDIAVEVSGTGKNGASFKNSYNSSDNNGIQPLVIYIDRENNRVSIGSKGTYHQNVTKISTDDDRVWVSRGSGHKEIIIKEVDGEDKIYVDGDEVDKDDLHEYGYNVFVTDDDDEEVKIHLSKDGKKSKHKSVKVKRYKDGKKGDSNVFIMRDSDNDKDVEVISSDGGFFFVDTDGEEGPLYVIDGKVASAKKVKKLSPSKIATINVLKGEAADKKYGAKAANGVVEITTKKN